MKTNTTILTLSLAVTLPVFSADDFATADFSLRFPAAFGHFSAFADVAAKGGASAASPFGSSFNPAGIAWYFQADPRSMLASAEYSNLSFDSDTQLHVAAQTFSFQAGDAGVFRLSLGEITSNHEITRLAPAAYEFDLLGARLDWSKRLNEDWGIGLGTGFSRSSTTFDVGGHVLTDTGKDNWSFRAGVQRTLGDRWLAGVAADYARGDNDADFNLPTALGIRRGSISYTTQQWIVQPGIAYSLLPPKEGRSPAWWHLDYQFGWFDNETNDLTINRWATGLDIPLHRGLNLRAGTAIDEHGNTAWTVGLGLYSSRATLSLAYQNDNFPELRDEFGNAQTLNLSVSYKW